MAELLLGSTERALYLLALGDILIDDESADNFFLFIPDGSPGIKNDLSGAVETFYDDLFVD